MTSVGGEYGFGMVFELTREADWKEKVLHSLNQDGIYPYAGLVFDSAGNLYGTTNWGGAYEQGSAFELSPIGDGEWRETILHYFDAFAHDGTRHNALILDGSGNVYGTASYGGRAGANDVDGGGMVFELSPTAGGGWREKVLHYFDPNDKDGLNPSAGLILDAAGNLYGTTWGGGDYNYGTVFELSPTAGGGWSETILHSFDPNGKDGIHPGSALIFDAAGNLYGTTYWGGDYNKGTVFEIKP